MAPFEASTSDLTFCDVKEKKVKRYYYVSPDSPEAVDGIKAISLLKIALEKRKTIQSDRNRSIAVELLNKRCIKTVRSYMIEDRKRRMENKAVEKVLCEAFDKLSISA